ncbi:hypothetical protein [Falsiroseomonas oryzae]|uniref:hypothetical protein n=1 Tax=Falsiroseomonas oryzae TaxID=2766473 RepID=UPI0022EB44E9|nr:hypothetical protein [Roseomonas sp. MO-31]
MTAHGDLAERAMRWPYVLAETVPHQLVGHSPEAEAVALAVPLLFDRAAPVTDAPHLLRLERHRLAPVLLDAERAEWRCTETGTHGRGALEMIAWVRACSLQAAACWFYAVRWAALRAAVPGRRAA